MLNVAMCVAMSVSFHHLGIYPASGSPSCSSARPSARESTDLSYRTRLLIGLSMAALLSRL